MCVSVGVCVCVCVRVCVNSIKFLSTNHGKSSQIDPRTEVGKIEKKTTFRIPSGSVRLIENGSKINQNGNPKIIIKSMPKKYPKMMPKGSKWMDNGNKMHAEIMNN